MWRWQWSPSQWHHLWCFVEIRWVFSRTLFLSTVIYSCTRYSLRTQFSCQHGKPHHKWTFLYHSSILRFCTAQDGQHGIKDWRGQQVMVSLDVPGVVNTRKRNPYLEAFLRPRVVTTAQSLQVPCTDQWQQGAQQHDWLLCSQRRPQTTDLPCHFEQAAKQFLDSISPTVSDLIEHLHWTHTSLTGLHAQANNVQISLDLARAKQVAQRSVQSVLVDLMMEGKYRQLEIVKPDNTICIMFENFSSLHLFVLWKEKGMKIRQINKLIKEYKVNIMDGCKARVDWRLTKSTTNGFNSLFAQRQQRRGICAHNIKKYVHQDLWEGTCMVAVGHLSTMTVAIGIDSKGLGRSRGISPLSTTP